LRREDFASRKIGVVRLVLHQWAFAPSVRRCNFALRNRCGRCTRRRRDTCGSVRGLLNRLGRLGHGTQRIRSWLRRSGCLLERLWRPRLSLCQGWCCQQAWQSEREKRSSQRCWAMDSSRRPSNNPGCN
jgi:hypothetical protein